VGPVAVVAAIGQDHRNFWQQRSHEPALDSSNVFRIRFGISTLSIASTFAT
jgi:hypothetical protein